MMCYDFEIARTDVLIYKDCDQGDFGRNPLRSLRLRRLCTNSIFGSVESGLVFRRSSLVRSYKNCKNCKNYIKFHEKCIHSIRDLSSCSMVMIKRLSIYNSNFVGGVVPLPLVKLGGAKLSVVEGIVLDKESIRPSKNSRVL